jgi:hypothetical protein
MIGDLPNSQCLTNPDLVHCTAFIGRCLTNPDSSGNCLIPDYDCPKGFAEMHSTNFTIPRCVPLSYADAKQDTRERQVLDQNRCPEGYRLDVNQEFDNGRGNIGRCILQ